MEHLQDLRRDASIYNIILRIDSPGGSVAGSTELAELVAAINKEKPVEAVVSDDCCSAAYYIASQCRSITANNSAWVGSIGVLVRLTDDSEFWAKIGIVDHVVDSGGVKGLGHDGKVTKELEAEMQRLVDGQAELFVNTVSQGRNMPAERVRQLATGRVWLAAEAKQLGLIDAVESVDSAIGRITTEILTMKREEFTAAAKSNPDWVAEYIEQGRQAAIADAKPKIATAAELKAAFPDEADRGFVFDRLGVDASIVEHQIAHRDALIKQRTEAAAKIDQLKNEVAATNPGSAGLPQPVGVTKPNAANPNPLIADAKRRAEAAAARK
jgi:signal peptide peptidase SppA